LTRAPGAQSLGADTQNGGGGGRHSGGNYGHDDVRRGNPAPRMSRHAALPRRARRPLPAGEVPPDCPAAAGSAVSLVDVGIRPWRYALVVRAGSAGDVARATALAAESWGGAGWPLLPVDVSGAPDATALAVAAAIGVDAVLDLRLPEPGRGHLDGNGVAFDRRAPDVPWPVLPVAAAELDVPGAPEGGGRCVPPDPHGAMLSVPATGTVLSLPATGRLADLTAAGTLADPRARALWLAAGTRLHEERDPVAMVLAQLAGRTPVVAGRHVAVATATGAPGTVALVWVTSDPEGGVADAIGFWNARALRGRGGVAGTAILADPDVLASPEVREALPEVIRASSSGEPACVVLSASVAADRLAAFAAEWGEAAYGPGGSDRIAAGADPLALWGGDVSPPTVPVVAVRQGDRIDLRVPAPLTVHPGLAGLGDVALTVAAAGIAGPRRPGVARLHHPSARWADDGLRIPMPPGARYDVTLRVPPPRDILAAALADRGVKVVSGDTGALVDRLVQKLSDPAVLRRPELQALLGALAVLGGVPGDPVPLPGLAAAAPVPVPGSGVCDVDSAGIAAVVDLLCDDGLVERAFRVDCGQCGVDAYPGMEALTDGAPVCAACGAGAGYARADSGEPAFHYRVHPLLRRLSYGPLPTVLAASAALLAEGAHIAAYPQVRTRRDWERLDALGWHGDSVFGLVAVHPAAAPPEVAVMRCAAAGVDVVVVASIGKLSETDVHAYAETADDAGLMLSVLDAGDLILPALAVRRRSERRTPPPRTHTLVIDLDDLSPATAETARAGDRGHPAP
jgi:hypothetical protein